MRTASWTWLLAAMVLGAWDCGGSPAPSQRSEGVTVNPGQVTLSPLGTQQFTATAEGQAAPVFTWRIVPPEGGTITQGGLYTAPAGPGDFQVVATLTDDPSQVGSAVVHVRAASPGSPGDCQYKGTITFTIAGTRDDVSGTYDEHAVLEDAWLFSATSTLYANNPMAPLHATVTVDDLFTSTSGTTHLTVSLTSAPISLAAIALQLDPEGGLYRLTANGVLVNGNFEVTSRDGTVNTTQNYWVAGHQSGWKPLPVNRSRLTDTDTLLIHGLPYVQSWDLVCQP